MARTYISSISQQAEHTIFYRFTCEQCGKDSEWLPKKVEATATLEGGHIKMDGSGNVSEQSRIEVIEQAHNDLKKAMEKYKKEFSQNEFHLNDTCPHCTKPQTWSKKGSVKLAFIRSFCIAGVAWILSFVPLAFEVEMPEGIHTIILVGLFFVPLVFTLGSHVIKAQKSKNVTSKQKPEIDWNGWSFE